MFCKANLFDFLKFTGLKCFKIKKKHTHTQKTYTKKNTKNKKKILKKNPLTGAVVCPPSGFYNISIYMFKYIRYRIDLV